MRHVLPANVTMPGRMRAECRNPRLFAATGSAMRAGIAVIWNVPPCAAQNAIWKKANTR